MFPVFLFPPITAMCRTGSHLIRMNSLLCVQPCVCSAAGGEEQEEAQDVMGESPSWAVHLLLSGHGQGCRLWVSSEFPGAGGELGGEAAIAAILIYSSFSSKSVLALMAGGEEWQCQFVLKCSCCSLNSLAELSLCCCFAFLFYPPKWQLDCGIQTCQQPAGEATGPALPAQ